MCGVAQKPGSDSELVVAPPTAMPPSITVGSDPNKGCTSPTGDAPRQPPNNSPANDKNVPTIDLASEATDDDDLQKAIALSLQEQKQDVSVVPGVSTEDQEVFRALEASLKESRPQATVDNANPHDRRRVSNTPVGLKNIGNSCWFSVVIQMLLYIKCFRDLILTYKTPSDDNFYNDTSKQRKANVVSLLRSLFALLIASHKKYVDPTMVVNIFQDQEMRKDAQQDVCEFIHKLLDRLENEFQEVLHSQGIEKESSDCYVSKDSDFNNPIKRLFYGQSCNETCEEEGVSKHITFGQYLLHVMNYKNIHQSILASMTKTMPDITKETVRPVEQETWFKLLPPVLIFSLSRYEYSKEKKRAEKVHNKFEFPQYLYMDRYMECNKSCIKQKHIKVAKLQEDLNTLVRTLDKYLKYGSGQGKYPLSDILKYTLEFAETNLNSNLDEASTCTVPSPSKMEVDSLENDIEMGEDTDVKKKEELIIIETIKKSDDVKPPEVTVDGGSPIRIPSPSKKMRIMPPTPGTMNANDLSVLQSCLSRWQQEVEQQVDELQKEISNLEEQLSKIYDDPTLQKIPYRLHGVVVHEGQASGGHYWVYIYDDTHKVWMKFNDIQVCQSQWEEVLQDSIGGQNNASAYCLMYIDENRLKTLFSNPLQRIEGGFGDIPLDLQEYVKNDNLKFRKELEEYNLKLRQQQQNISATSATEGDNALMVNDSSSVMSKDNIDSLLDSFFSPVVVDEENISFFIAIETMTTDAAQKYLESLVNSNEASNYKSLDISFNDELLRLKGFSFLDFERASHKSACLLDPGIYMLNHGLAEEEYIKWYYCEILWLKKQQFGSNIKINGITMDIIKYINKMQDSEEHCSVYKAWKTNYRNLLNCAWYFVQGFQFYRNNKYEKASLCLYKANQLNRSLEAARFSRNHKCFERKVLLKCKRMCLLDFNSKLIEDFVNSKSEKQYEDVCDTVTNYIVPFLSHLDENFCQEDTSLAEHIRQEWCSLIDDESLPIQQILDLVLNSDHKCMFREDMLRIPRLPVALSLYKQFLDTCKSVMVINEKTAQTSHL